MSANQPSKNEQAARHFLRSHGIAGNLMVRPLLDLLDRTEAEALGVVSEIVPCPDCPAGGPFDELCDDCGGSGLDTKVMDVDEASDRIEALRAQVAELERQLEIVRDLYQSSVAEGDLSRSERDASRIEAARLREVLETLAVETVHFNSAAHHECRICGRSSPHGAPPIAHLETCVLAATSESAAAWLAEVQRKALERGKE